MFRRNYARERNRDKGSFIRLRGNIWFQLVMMLISTIVFTIAALYLTVFIDFLWHLLLLIKTWFESITLQGEANIAWAGFFERYKNYLWLDNAWTHFWQINNWWIYGISAGLWVFFIFNRVARQWYDWFNMFSDRANDANHFATFYEIDSVYVLIPDRNKIYDDKPGQLIAHVHGLHWRVLMFHPILWTKQLLKTPLGLNRQVWPKWYLKVVRPLLISKMPDKFADQLTVTGGFTGFYWVDPTPTHDIKTGASRSGKDQTQGYPLIDIISRSKQPWNIIDTDAKNEDYKMSYKALRTRGFDVMAINIDDVFQSESFNPFQLALDYAMDGDLERAKIEVSKIVQIIAGSSAGQADGTIWDKTAQSTMQAIILMLLRLAMTENKPTIATPASLVQIMESFNRYKDDSEDGLTKYLNNLGALNNYYVKNGQPNDPLINEIRLLAASFLGSSGDTKTSVIFTVHAGSKLFGNETIARLTARSTMNPLEMAFPRLLKVRLPQIYANQAATIKLFDTDSEEEKELELDKVQVSNSGVMNYPFQAKFPANWQIKVTFADSVNMSALRASEVVISGIKTEVRGFNGEVKLDEYSKQPTYVTQIINISRNLFNPEAEMLRTDMQVDVYLQYSEKPKAVFIITPQDNDDYASIATLYISQVFAVTTSLASKITRRKLTNPILYKLNEFSMFPRIPGFNNLLTRGLTYGHMVDIYLQSLAQLNMQYTPDEVQEIRDNTLNWFHILTPNKETNEALSDALGEREIQTESVNSQMGEDRANRGNRHVNKEKVRLLSANEISQMLDQEQITIRLAKRLDKKGRQVRALPVFATGPYKMPKAYQTIGKLFNLNYFTTDMGIKSKTRKLTYGDVFQDFSPYYDQLENQVTELTADEVNEELLTTQATEITDTPSEYDVFLQNLDLNEPLIDQTNQKNMNVLNEIIAMVHNAAAQEGVLLSSAAEQNLRNYQFKTMSKGEFRDTYLNQNTKYLYEVEQVMLGQYDDDWEQENVMQHTQGRL